MAINDTPIGDTPIGDTPIGDTPIGATAAKSFLLLSLAPGSHKLSFKSEAPSLPRPDPNEPVSVLHLDLVDGQTAFVWQEVKSSNGHAQSALHEVSPEEDRANRPGEPTGQACRAAPRQCYRWRDDSTTRSR